jgi:excisionase family DNA binding protein
MSERALLTPEQGADQLQVGRTRMYALIKSGEIKSVKIGRLRRIPASAIAAFIERLDEDVA